MDEEEEGGEEGAVSGGSYGMIRSEYSGINLKEERSYSQEPDKAFKFYLGTLLFLFVVIYAVQAIMVYR